MIPLGSFAAWKNTTTTRTTTSPTSSPAPTTTTTTSSATTSSVTTTTTTGATGPQFFSPTSFWNQAVPADAQLEPTSSDMVAQLLTYVNAELAAKDGPWINAGHDGVAIYTVPANEPTVSVKLDHIPDAALSTAWSAVPLPPSAHPSSGDNDLAVWQPSTNRMWEFFQLHMESDGWHAEWGGAMNDVASDPGVYGPGAWPGAKTYWGVTAASFPIVGGAISFSDLAAGQINHALALVVPNTRYHTYASPAERDDGQASGPYSLPEGAHLRLDPSLNLASLNMPPMTRMIADAAQRYGIIIRDTGPIVAFFGQDPTGNPVAQNLYASAYSGLYAFQLMSYFPWSHLQVLKMDLHTGT